MEKEAWDSKTPIAPASNPNIVNAVTFCNASFESINTKLITLNSKLDSTNFDLVTIKRTYSISIELLYNIIYHGVKFNNETPELNFNIRVDEKHVYLQSSNYISYKDVDSFRSTLCNLNLKSFDELRKMKGNQIKNGGITEKGGAGLGLIDICMKSGNHVDMNLKTINEDIDWMTLEVKIDLV